MIDFDRGEILHDEVIGNLHLRLREFVLTIYDSENDEKTTIPLSDIEEVSVDIIEEVTEIDRIIAQLRDGEEDDDEDDDLDDSDEETRLSNLSLIIDTTGSSIEFLAMEGDEMEDRGDQIGKLNHRLERFAQSVQDQIDFLYN